MTDSANAPRQPKPRKWSTDPAVRAILGYHRERNAFFSWLQERDYAPRRIDGYAPVYIPLEHQERFEGEVAELTGDAAFGYGLTPVRFEVLPDRD